MLLIELLTTSITTESTDWCQLSLSPSFGKGGERVKYPYYILNLPMGGAMTCSLWIHLWGLSPPYLRRWLKLERGSLWVIIS
jgi:hypothetical protein